MENPLKGELSHDSQDGSRNTHGKRYKDEQNVQSCTEPPNNYEVRQAIIAWCATHEMTSILPVYSVEPLVHHQVASPCVPDTAS